MIVDLDKTIELNRELLEMGHEIVKKKFLGPKKIGELVQLIIKASACYNDICLALMGERRQNGQVSGDV